MEGRGTGRELRGIKIRWKEKEMRKREGSGCVVRAVFTVQHGFHLNGFCK